MPLTAVPNVSFIRPELAKVLSLYFTIRDCLSGSETVKKAKDKYLPIPNSDDKSAANTARYKEYLARAVFYNVTRRTLAGLVGQIFSRDPVVKVPATLEGVIKDVDGTGLTIEQQAMRSCNYVTSYSRSGLFVDYPATGGEVTVAELNSGKIQPTITQFAPWQIINWRTKKVGSKTIFTLVVISEVHCIHDDGFEMKNAGRFRVLKLNEAGNYVQEIWTEPQPTTYDGTKPLKGNFTQKQVVNVLGPDGQPFKEIPFMFIGSENNDEAVDYPNLYDMADLNIAHYRNSADYEEACFIVGQPTVAATGLTKQWVDDVLKGKLAMGSRGGIPLPVGASVELLQAEERTMIKEAMDTKERQMVALGAKLVQQKDVQRTATESKLEASSESSVLSNIAKNVSAAYVWALEWCGKFANAGESKIEFKLNDDFDLSNYTVEQQNAVVKNWQAGALTFPEMRAVLRKAGQATEEDKKAEAEIVKAQQEAATFEASLNEPAGAAA
jgi:hypothetical protein